MTTRRIRILKRLLLLLVLVVGLGTVGLYLLGRAARLETEPLPAHEGIGEEGGAQQVGEGFDHTVSHEGKALFRIRGLRDRRDREGNVHVDEVHVTLFRDDGSRWEMSADRATYDLTRREAVLEGDVTLRGAEGLSLHASGVELRDEGTVVEARGPVRFQRAGGPVPFRGEARSLKAGFPSEQFVLRDAVRIETLPGDPREARLDAHRFVFYDRREGRVKASGPAALAWGPSWVQAQDLTAHLDEAQERLTFVNADQRVVVELSEPASASDGARHLRATGEHLELWVAPDGREPERLELDGGERSRAHVVARQEAGTVLDLLAHVIQVGFSGGRVESVEGVGNVELEQRSADGAGPVRVTGGTLTAHVGPQGELLMGRVEKDVAIVEPGRRLRAERATVTPETIDAAGEPAVLISDRGELRAPKISYARGTGIAHATGGVEATLQREEGGAWRQTPLAAGDEPVRVEAREGYWQERPRTFLFRGGVRAWSGERLLLADQLRGDVDRDELAAAGGVETLWFVPPRQGAGGDPRPLRLTADTLIYDQKGDLLTYSGGVVVVDAERRLSCDELRVQLTGDGEAERMTCTGSVALSAPEEGRTVKAERAEYDLASERLVFHGEPVEVQDGKGGRLHGRRVTYHMDSGKVSVSGQDRDGQAAGQGGGRPAPAGGSR